jgi:hypothetical protein
MRNLMILRNFLLIKILSTNFADEIKTTKEVIYGIDFSLFPSIHSF